MVLGKDDNAGDTDFDKKIRPPFEVSHNQR